MAINQTKTQKSITYLCVIVVLAFSLFPFIQILSTSLKHPADWGNPSLIPSFIHTEAYEELLGLNISTQKVEIPETIQNILENPALTQEQRDRIISNYQSTEDIFPFIKYMINTFLISSVTATFALFLALMAAYALARLNFPGRNTMSNGILLIYMIGGVLLMIPLYQMSVGFGLTNTLTGTIITLLLIYLTQTLPVAIYMLGNYFRTIPFSLEEAAMIDGCSRFEAIWRIIFPLSIPMLVTVFVYCFVIAWNEYLFASVFLKQYSDAHTLPLALKTLFDSKNAIWDRIMAASVLTLLPIVIVFGFANKRLAGGMTRGGVKE